ncbi:hypothetical protein JTB14_030322 [Gonioctena quinquepunctata]|nr:hypothetical protein JTB14_030322 [Gonioctena quinquepunctata]
MAVIAEMNEMIIIISMARMLILWGPVVVDTESHVSILDQPNSIIQAAEPITNSHLLSQFFGPAPLPNSALSGNNSLSNVSPRQCPQSGDRSRPSIPSGPGNQNLNSTLGID